MKTNQENLLAHINSEKEVKLFLLLVLLYTWKPQKLLVES